MYSNIVVRLGRNALVGKKGTAAGILRELGSLSTMACLDIVARLSAVLLDDDSHQAAEQTRLISALLPALAPGILKRVHRAERRERQVSALSPRIVVFDELAVLNVAKLVLVSDRPESGPDSDSPFRVGRAVLQASDLVDAGPATPRGATEATRLNLERWAYYTFVSQLARYDEDGVHAIARAHEVVFRLPSQMFDSPYYVDVAKHLSQRTSLTIDEFWSWLFGVQAHYRVITPDNVATATGMIDLASYFSDEFLPFSAAENEAMLALFARNVAEMRDRIVRDHDSGSIAPFDVTAFYETPLVRSGMRIVAPSVRLFLGKICFGLHHTVLHAMPQQSRGRYLQFIGASFETYIGDLLDWIAHTQQHAHLTANRLADALGAKRHKVPKLADGILFDQQTMLVWDAKAWFAPGDVLSGKDLRGFVEWLRKLVLRTGRQIANTVELQRSGVFEDAGLDGQRRQVVPVIITFQPVLTTPHLHRLVRTLLAESDVQMPADTTPLIFANPAELEWLEPIVQPSRTLQSILIRKISQPEYEGETLHNACLAMQLPQYGFAKSPYLTARYEALGARMREVAAARRGSLQRD